jgi:hypothetical protein
MEVKVKQVRKINPWSQRTIIQIPHKQFKKLISRGKCKTVQNYQWYIIQRQPDIMDVPLFDANGVRLSKAQIKRLLKGVK